MGTGMEMGQGWGRGRAEPHHPPQSPSSRALWAPSRPCCHRRPYPGAAPSRPHARWAPGWLRGQQTLRLGAMGGPCTPIPSPRPLTAPSPPSHSVPQPRPHIPYVPTSPPPPRPHIPCIPPSAPLLPHLPLSAPLIPPSCSHIPHIPPLSAPLTPYPPSDPIGLSGVPGVPGRQR